MLYETVQAIRQVVRYTRLPHGRWRATVGGPIAVSATGDSPHECLSAVTDAVDRELAEMIAAGGAAQRTAGKKEGRVARPRRMQAAGQNRRAASARKPSSR